MSDAAPSATEPYEERERIAAANAVRAFLEPRSCAVIGASRDVESIGGRLFRNLVTQPFGGVVYPVNAKAPFVQGVAAYPSIAEVPGDVELAFIAVPAAHVIEAADGCGRKGVRGLVVISAGFGEVGPEGIERQRELVDVCRGHGMRLIGPNCMGVANTDPAIRLNGTFVSAWPPEGRVAFMSQSGALGLAIMQQATALGLGLSSFVSVGNKADISGNDLLAYWEQDPRTDVVLLYLESLGNPRRFASYARRIGRRKPIVAVKSGRTAAGARATSSHTGALLAANDTAADALFRQHGVIRTDTLEEMFDVATLLANQPVPAGNRVAIVTNAGGLGIQCADTCEARGLHVPELDPSTVAALQRFLPAEASVGNPVDMIASAGPDDYARAIAAVAADPGVDALIVIYIPPLEHDAPPIARALIETAAGLEREIPLLTCFMSARGVPDVLRAPGIEIPRTRTRSKPPSRSPTPRSTAAGGPHPTDRGPSCSTCTMTRSMRWSRAPWSVAHRGSPRTRSGDSWTAPGSVASGRRSWRPPTRHADAATRFGDRVALKAAGPLHKTEAQAVRIDVAPEEVLRAAKSMIETLSEGGQEISGFIVQEMVRGGTEMLVGMVADPVFGPVVAVGAGGVTVELTRDVAVRVAPLTDRDADEMVHELATFPLLDGFRGAPKKDVAALTDVLLRVSALADAHPEIAEMDLNPVMVLPRGAVVVDARVRVRARGLEPSPAGRPDA